MTTQTPHLDLTLYDNSTDLTKTFNEFRTNLAGISASNFIKIDDAVGALQGQNIVVVDGVNYPQTQAGIISAIASASSNYTVYVPAGAYSITSIINISGKTNFHLVFGKGAVLTATSGVTFSMLAITSSSDITVTGGKFDATLASSSAGCITIYNTSTTLVNRIKIEDTECFGAPGTGIQATHNGTNFWYVNDIIIQNNYVHDCSIDGIVGRSVNNIKIVGNKVDNVASTKNGIWVNAINVLISQNTISGYSGTAGRGIGGYMTVDGVCSNNIIDGETQDTSGTGAFGIYFDAPKNLVISNNTIRSGGTGIRSEVGADVLISGNTLSENGYHGITVNGRSDSVQVNALDATTGITASANVTLSADTVDKQEGTGSLQAVVAAGFTTGTLFYQDLASLEDWATRPFIYIWVKSDTIINSGVLTIALSATTGLASPHTILTIPYITSAQWTPLRLFSEKGFNSPEYSVRSWGVIATSDPGAITLHFDDFRSGTFTSNNTVSDNIISKPYISGITFDTNGTSSIAGNATETSIISNNNIYSPGFSSNYTSGATYGIFINSTHASAVIKGTTISGNTISYMGNGTTSTDRGIGIRAVGGTVNEIRLLNNSLSKTKTQILLSGTAPTNYTNAGNLLYEGEGNVYSGVTHTVVSQFANAGNVTTGVDDLYSDTLPANTFYAAGQCIRLIYSGYFIGHATATRQLIMSFGGTTIFDSTALAITSTTQWYLEATIIASNIAGGTARAVVSFRRATTLSTATETNLTGITFTNSNILKITGESAGTGGGVSGDIVAQLAQGVWYP